LGKWSLLVETQLAQSATNGVQLTRLIVICHSFAVEVKWITGIYKNKPRDLRRDFQNIDSTFSYKFKIEKKRRLHSIHLRTTISYWNRLKNAALTFQGRKNVQSRWESLNVNRRNHERDFSSSFLLTGYSNNHFKCLSFTSNTWVSIYEILLFAYHDECGHPEVPLHGYVKYKPDDNEAIYRCDDGYQLDSNYSTRRCIQGEWNGPQPICIRLIKDIIQLNNITDGPVSSESVTAETKNRE
jgi:Sushi repeat (SCR repeat)